MVSIVSDMCAPQVGRTIILIIEGAYNPCQRGTLNRLASGGHNLFAGVVLHLRVPDFTSVYRLFKFCA